MFRPLIRSHRRPPRRGTAILITCFFLITIMMVTGLALVMYAAREKAAALAYQEGAATPTRVAPDPTLTVNQFLSALIYDTADDGPALQNSLRGHSIARAMYSGNPTGQANWAGSTTPWAGVGLFHEMADTYAYDSANTSTIYPSLAGVNRGRIVNYCALSLDDQLLLIDPEWRQNRQVTAGSLPAFSASAPSRSFVSKAAGYTYPDLKNFFLGARDPYTGEVLVPSFFRDWLFRDSNRPPTESPLHPNNSNWTNAAGKLLTLRPRPAEHPNFPRVPPNADGSYTGDVQNLPGAYYYDSISKQFIAKNDSLWMHIGLAPITLPDGRRVQPLVAPLILPLDGVFDWSVHGNVLGASSAHQSYGGYGPWEVNITPGIVSNANTESNRQALITQRVHTPNRSAAFDPYTSGQPLPRYAPVAWNGNQVQRLQLPNGNSLLGLPSFGNPSFTPPYGDFQSNNASVNNHPASYNWNEFGPRNDTTNLTSPVFPFTDLKRFSLRYAFSPDWYDRALATKAAQDTFLGLPGTYGYIANPAANTISNYRLDPAHTRRLVFTPRSSALDRPALAPNFLNQDGTSAIAIAAGQTKPGALFTTPVPYPTPQNTGPGITDFAGANQWYNVQAALGSVNLNRPLADYRTDTSKALGVDVNSGGGTDPLLAKNIGNLTNAEKDRQALAKDIFARLIVTTGAAGRVSFDATNGVQIVLPDPTTGTYTLNGVNYTVDQYNALRYLAQLAVNIVDYIDNDDISTVFVWNPPTTGTADFTNSLDVGRRVVFGVEKPRLVLNEAYSEITNDQIDKIDGDFVGGMFTKPTGQINVRFWLELLNPTQTANPVGVLGDGSVPLSAYAIQIRRETRKTGQMAADQDTNPAQTPGQNQEPFLFGSPMSAVNPSGAFDETKGKPDATFELSKATVPNPLGSLAPNDAQYSQANMPAKGMILVGPPARAEKTGSEEFNPSGGVWTGMIQSPALQPAKSQAGGMGYTFPLPDANSTFSDKEFKRHIVLLRRAANPYLTPNDPLVSSPYNGGSQLNPYVTVDVMDYVPAFDAVHRGKEDGQNRNVRPGAPNGYDPVSERFSIGKVQPLAGYSSAIVTAGAGMYNKYLFNGAVAPVQNSMVLQQKGSPSLPVGGNPKPNEPGANTFGRHNGQTTQPGSSTVNNPANTVATITGNDTIMLPFDWQVHLDRPLETLGDVFFARDSRPHMLTQEFVANTTTGLNYESGYALWTRHSDGLTRALELLSVKSPSVYVPHGGRVGGRINANVMQDLRIAQGVWDPQASNQTQFNSAFVTNTIWGASGSGWMNSRSPLATRTREDGTNTINVPVPTSSVADLVTGGVDRPFLPFGTPSVPTGVSGTFAYTAPNTTNDGDTIMRRPQPTAGVPNPEPYLVLDPVADSNVTRNRYTQTEPLRKVMNNLTTVSHTFVVYLTIGYFHLDSESTPQPTRWPTGANVPPTSPQFGVEEYNEIPGDMRQKFVAVIDMSNMALKPLFPTSATDTDPHYDPSLTVSQSPPFFTALAATARPGYTTTGGVTTVDPNASVTLTLASGGGDGTTFSIPTDGQTAIVRATDKLVLGYGSETQVVTVQSVGTAGPTVNQITVTGLTRDVWGGTCVSNVRPGYAGPRADFNYTLPKYKPVVPYVERLK